jgi:hypothetical protein
MRLVLAALCIAASASMACAHSPDEEKGQPSPQGPTGSLTTGSGGQTAASPQGGTPPNMHPVPEGSKTSADQK